MSDQNVDTILTIVGFVVLAVIVLFAWAAQFRFMRQLAENRKAGVYDVLEFKRQIRPLKMQRYRLAALELMIVLVLLMAFGYRLLPGETVLAISIPAIVVLTVILHFVDRRWRKLMIHGAEKPGS